MTPQQFNRKNIDFGDKVEIKVRHSYAKNKKTTKAEVFFKGFRICAGARVSDGYATLVPVFVKPTKKGYMGRSHYGYEKDEIPTWFENIVSIKKIKNAS